jgi:hypothetical protein
VKHVNTQALQHIQNEIYGKIIASIEPLIPLEMQKVINIQELRQAPELHFDM